MARSPARRWWTSGSVAASLLMLGACSGERSARLDAGDGRPASTAEALESQGTITETLAADPTMTIMLANLRAAGMGEILSDKGPYTLFAPTNLAFSRLEPGTVEALRLPERKPLLVRTIALHVVPGEMSSNDLTNRIERSEEGSVVLKTAGGSPLTATLVDGHLTLTDARGQSAILVTTDIPADNGVVHVIDRLMMPG
ncbi:fasciclin domain-containing protein [Sphingomicrobium lutaoense]|uniref:Putative surface protein with fasciclin (FAS1) repeats n=1 Tax=Sphingomicrobium lutaoense TaxID=515949 RepID=A0A839Z4F3_9SPHN|nr:fasciclin domain-containing protein [Sphingomicrobium lutaoense]MBB3764733.1 putative surface protein with fasciclin (FAS1) repeats [Sphingomicrobium lutaoense]